MTAEEYYFDKVYNKLSDLDSRYNELLRKVRHGEGTQEFFILVSEINRTYEILLEHPKMLSDLKRKFSNENGRELLAFFNEGTDRLEAEVRNADLEDTSHLN